MSEWFHVGQKVVCVDGGPHVAPERYSVLPVEGGVYTIRGVSKWDRWSQESASGVGVWLEELRRPVCSLDGIEHPWRASRFRPLRKRKTDISWAVKLLNKEPVEA